MAQCVRCGASLRPGNRFCEQCGAAVPAAPAGAPVTAPTPPAQATASPAAVPSGAEPVPGRRHSAWAALLFGIPIPGAGQAYNGQPIKGFFLHIGTLLVIPYLYSLYDAYATGRRIVAEGGRIGRGGLLWVFLQAWLTFCSALLVLLVLTLAGVLQ